MTLEWQESGVEGAKRFLGRLWNLAFTYSKNPAETAQIRPRFPARKKPCDVMYIKPLAKLAMISGVVKPLIPQLPRSWN